MFANYLRGLVVNNPVARLDKNQPAQLQILALYVANTRIYMSDYRPDKIEVNFKAKHYTSFQHI